MSLGLRIAALGDAHGTSSWSRFQMRLPSGRNAHHTPPGGLGSTPPLLSEPTRMSRWPRPSSSPFPRRSARVGLDWIAPPVFRCQSRPPVLWNTRTQPSSDPVTISTSAPGPFSLPTAGLEYGWLTPPGASEPEPSDAAQANE